MKKPRILIDISGGLIQSIITDTDIDVVIYDFDTEGCNDEDLSEINGDLAYVHAFDPVEVDEDNLEDILNQINRGGSSSAVNCKFCHRPVNINTAHLHDNGYVGECCWDERLRQTE